MTLHDGLDLFATLEDMTVSMRNKKVYRKEYVDNLRNALEAALAVIDASDSYEEYAKEKDGIEAMHRDFKMRQALDTALLPFRKEGLG